jgi:hypothetical protein
MGNRRKLFFFNLSSKEKYQELVLIFGITIAQKKRVKKLKNLFVFSNASQACLYAFSAFKACATREWEIFCTFFAHRSFAFRAFH